jgi:CheY-like chemotaxis protein
MKQAYRFSERLFVSTGQAARHYQASLPALKGWTRDGWLVAFKAPEGLCRKEREELQRSLRQYGIFLCTISAPYICILISNEDLPIAKLFADTLADDLRGFHLDTATHGYDALIKVDMFRLSLLILDVCIPRLDGMAVCRCLQANPMTMPLGVIVKSAEGRATQL